MKRMEPTNNFICARCSAIVCDDCKSIAEEWAELAQRRARELFAIEDRLKVVEQELTAAKRRADDYERIMKLGQHALLLAWMDDNGPAEVVRKMGAAAKGRREDVNTNA